MPSLSSVYIKMAVYRADMFAPHRIRYAIHLTRGNMESIKTKRKRPSAIVRDAKPSPLRLALFFLILKAAEIARIMLSIERVKKI